MEENRPTKGAAALNFTSNGNGTCYVSGIGTCEDKHIVLPDAYDGERVTGIGELAFYKCAEMTKIEIPDSVTSIGDNAFQGCVNLTKIELPDGMTSIGDNAFQGCTNLEKIEIPDSVTKIGDSAFFNCTHLKEIKFIGTSEKWEAVSKGENWNLLVPAEIIFAPPKQKKFIGSKNIPNAHENKKTVLENPLPLKKKKRKLPKVMIALFLTTIFAFCCMYQTWICYVFGHTGGEWEIEKEATETESGMKVQKCMVCKEKLNESIISATLVGQTITFGAYEQDNNTANGKEAIEWIVLDVKDGKALVISKYALDCKQYNETYTSVTWETCPLRAWLNDDFLNSAFSAEEKAKIPTVTVSADKNPSYSTNPGNATQDQIFLLSITEANKYFSSNSERTCQPTAYAKAQGVWTSSSGTSAGNCWWWLRSPGSSRNLAADVSYDGFVYYSGYYVNSSDYAVRPALWIDLES